MARKPGPRTEVPPGMQVQLNRLFGPNSWETKNDTRTAAQWKQTLDRVLNELERYLAKNVHTDEVHLLMLYSGIVAARESLKAEEYWPGYLEGIVRFALLLMGDYPDHRHRRGNAKSENYYRLNRCRSLHYSQTYKQMYWTLNAAEGLGAPELRMSAREALNEFRRRHGVEPGLREFFMWYRRNFPDDYAAVF